MNTAYEPLPPVFSRPFQQLVRPLLAVLVVVVVFPCRHAACSMRHAACSLLHARHAPGFVFLPADMRPAPCSMRQVPGLCAQRIRTYKVFCSCCPQVNYLLRADPEDRPTTQEILQLAYVRKHLQQLLGIGLPGGGWSFFRTCCIFLWMPGWVGWGRVASKPGKGLGRQSCAPWARLGGAVQVHWMGLFLRGATSHGAL